MLVMKFGGTSVQDADAFAQVAAIVEQYLAEQPVVVLSAMSGVTNDLLSMAERAAAGEAAFANGEGVAPLLERHLATIGQAVSAGSEREAARRAVEAYGDDLRGLLHGVCLLHELTPRSRDAIAAFGEKLAVAVLTGVLLGRGIAAEAVSAEDLIVTDDCFGHAAPLPGPTNRRVARRLWPLLQQGTTPIVTGFIGRTASGVTTTLGRGGSDYSASLIGAALPAREIWIWTDVDGVMTADPRAVPQARPLASLTYAEAAELSYFGARVLHPRTVGPAIARSIPVRIKNTFNPAFPGTLVGGPADGANGNGQVVKAVTAVQNLSLVTVQGAGMIGVPGIAARVFAAVAAGHANVLMISQSSSEYNICFVVDGANAISVVAGLQAEFARERAQGDISAWAQDGLAILAAVGEGMRGTPGVAGRLFSALGRQGINVIAIAQGSSELNISIVVADAQRLAALRCVHDEFIG